MSYEYVVLLETEVDPEIRAKAARCLAAMLKDAAVRPVRERYPLIEILWMTSRKEAEAAGIDVHGREFPTPPTPGDGTILGLTNERSGSVWLNAKTTPERIGTTVAHELGHLARYAWDADELTQRAVKGWRKADDAEHEQSAKAMERLLRRLIYA